MENLNNIIQELNINEIFSLNIIRFITKELIDRKITNKIMLLSNQF
jgi:hypothetical protein